MDPRKSSAALPREGHRAAWALVALGAALLAYRALLSERFVVDDLFITLRYARGLAERGELAFSPGDRVEGTSSLVWAGALGAAWALGLRGPAIAKALSLACALAVPGLSAIAVRRALPERPLALVIPAAALALDCDLGVWAISGMDTPLFALAAAACACLVASGHDRAAAAALGALAWVRPEGPFVGALGLAALVFASPAIPAGGFRARAVHGARLALAFAVPLAALAAARGLYFHDVLPNTFYAKMGPTAGDTTGPGYVLSELARRPLLVALPFAGAWLGRGARSSARARTTAAVALAIGGAVFAFGAAAGGDWMANRRLLVPALAPLAIGGAILLGGATRRRAVAVGAAAILFVEGAWSTSRALDQTWRRRETLDVRLTSWTPSAEALRAPYPVDWMPHFLLEKVAPYVQPGDWVAHVDVGQLPYVMHDVGFLDGFGLVDRAAGRVAFRPSSPGARAGAREAFFARRPAAAIVVLQKETREAIAPAQAAVLGDARFDQEYVAIAEVPTWGGHACVFYVRRDRPPASPEIAAARTAAWLSAAPGLRASP